MAQMCEAVDEDQTRSLFQCFCHLVAQLTSLNGFAIGKSLFKWMDFCATEPLTAVSVNEQLFVQRTISVERMPDRM